jgi:hypothetical protein
VDEEVALSRALRLQKSFVSLQKNPYVTKQNPRYTRGARPNGDLLIHHYTQSVGG